MWPGSIAGALTAEGVGDSVKEVDLRTYTCAPLFADSSLVFSPF